MDKFLFLIITDHQIDIGDLFSDNVPGMKQKVMAFIGVDPAETKHVLVRQGGTDLFFPFFHWIEMMHVYSRWDDHDVGGIVVIKFIQFFVLNNGSQRLCVHAVKYPDLFSNTMFEIEFFFHLFRNTETKIP